MIGLRRRKLVLRTTRLASSRQIARPGSHMSATKYAAEQAPEEAAYTKSYCRRPLFWRYASTPAAHAPRIAPPSTISAVLRWSSDPVFPVISDIQSFHRRIRLQPANPPGGFHDSP